MLKEKLNILIVTEAFYPDDAGGAHTYVYNLAKALIKRGHKIWVLTLRTRKDVPYEENIEGINLSRYDSTVSGPIVFVRRPLLSIINSYRLFNRLSNDIDFDLINFHSPLPAFGVILSSKGRNILKIYTFHSSVFQEVLIQSQKKKYALFFNPLLFYIIKIIERICLNSCKKIVTLSEFNKGQLLKLYNIAPDKISVVAGGVDIEKFKPSVEKFSVRERLNLPKDKIIILTVRRLVARMGVENLIYAMRAVVKKGKSIFLIIAGEGFLHAELGRLIEDLKLKDHIKLLGFIADEQLVLYYQAADFFVLPTQSLEGFGLVTLEALSSGLPVLGTPVGGTIEILQKLDKDFLFKDTASEQIAGGILNFIKERNRWEEIGIKCRKYVMDNYSWDEIAKENEKLFMEIVYRK